MNNLTKIVLMTSAGIMAAGYTIITNAEYIWSNHRYETMSTNIRVQEASQQVQAWENLPVYKRISPTNLGRYRAAIKYSPVRQ